MLKRHILPLSAALALLAGCAQAPTAPSEATITPRFEGGIFAGSGNVVGGDTTQAGDTGRGGNFGGSGN